MSGGMKESYAAADIRYLAAFQEETVPARLRLAAALQDAIWNPDHESLTVIDIGCGRGVTATVLAAANPGWDVHGLDLQPAHIAEAREIAEEAGLSNLHFHEADIAALDEAALARTLPEADLIILYGVWTWVPDVVREGIVRLLGSRLKPGGMLLIGYNSLPGFSDSVVLQRIMAQGMAASSGSDAERAGAAVGIVKVLADAGARYLPAEKMLERLTGYSDGMSSYLAHEYGTGFWRPEFGFDVRKAMVPARLDYVGSAVPAEVAPELNLRPEQRLALEGLPPGMDRDFMMDLFLLRRFRRDVFIKGKRPGGRGMLAHLPFALFMAPEKIELSIQTIAGRAELPAAANAALIEALVAGPKTLGQLASLPACSGLSPADLGLILSTTNTALPLWRAPGTGDAARAARTNRVLLSRLGAESAASSSPLGFVVPALGGGHIISASDLGVACALQSGVPPEPTVLAQRLCRPGATAEEATRVEQGAAGLLARHYATWKALGAV
ncbi:MAG: methylase [Rhodospirillales bacterium]|nr:methylase [Rhodospirillales bacterium]